MGGDLVILNNPDPPTNIKLIGATTNSLDIIWSEGLQNGGSQVLDFQIYA
jgi:hypothetical protein